jgi:transposase InsO family protein
VMVIEPGNPNQNAFVESFNGRLHDEYLNEQDPLSLTGSKSGSRSYSRLLKLL